MRESKPLFDITDDRDFKFAIITASWNHEFNNEMAESARAALEELNLSVIDEFQVPGALEMPLMALELAEEGGYDAIICFGTIFRGETLHFELVAQQSARGLMDVSLATSVPILNGVLACENHEQAKVRASREQEDKGREVALSAIALVQQIAQISSRYHAVQG
ncbi:MAG: 6,7-dimethyl-8-ribityllumazine synthase [Candidatus Melainabacteria bacterium]|nr:6,7-dimethyl-8-ribityllumazine synthase [Candidatus Melainabacteria bacterium]